MDINPSSIVPFNMLFFIFNISPVICPTFPVASSIIVYCDSFICSLLFNVFDPTNPTVITPTASITNPTIAILFLLRKTSIAINTAIAIKKPKSPTLVPIRAIKYTPTRSNTIIAGILYFLSFIRGSIINVEIQSIAPKLLPDSIQPL